MSQRLARQQSSSPRRLEKSGSSASKRLAKTAEGPPDDGVRRVLELTQSTSTVIRTEGEGHVVTTGVLLGVEVRPARPGEIQGK
jgi:hypothetical protein